MQLLCSRLWQIRRVLQMVVKCRCTFFLQTTILNQEPIVVVEEKESNATPGPADASQAGKSRLVIRVVIPQDPAPRTSNASGLNTRAIALALVVLAALTLTWLGYSLFSSERPDAKVASEAPAKPDAQAIAEPSSREPTPVATDEAPSQVAQSAADTAPGEHATNKGAATNDPAVATSAQQRADVSLSPVNQVIPAVPRSALQTIRGTIRVGVQVSIDKEGNVLAATSKDPGPSRYFERLSLEAARKWTFTPSTSDKERIMLIRFHYTQEGATVHPSLPDGQH
jgi:TonB family protein